MANDKVQRTPHLGPIWQTAILSLFIGGVILLVVSAGNIHRLRHGIGTSPIDPTMGLLNGCAIALTFLGTMGIHIARCLKAQADEIAELRAQLDERKS